MSRTTGFVAWSLGLCAFTTTLALCAQDADAQIPPITWRASSVLSDCAGPRDGAGTLWSQPDFDESGWAGVTLPAKGDVPNYRDRFYRGTFTVDGRAAATISFDSDDGVDIYVNGMLKGHWGGACHHGGCVGRPASCSGPIVNLDITNDLVHGRNVVAVHLSNGGGSSFLNLYFTSLTMPPLDLLEPDRDGFCLPTCRFDWAPATTAPTKYVLLTNGAVRKDNIPPTETAYQLTVSEQLSQGAHTWTVQACTGGSCTQSPNTFTVNIDGTPPAPFGLTEPSESAWRSRNIPFTFQWAPTSDGASATPSGLRGYELVLDGQVRATVPASQTTLMSSDNRVWPHLSNAAHTWAVNALDTAGNATAAASRTLRIDSTFPSFPAFPPLPANNSWTSDTTPVLSWQAANDTDSGVASYRVVLDTVNQPLVDATVISFEVPTALADGLHRWYVVAIDQAGNEGTTSQFTFGVDTRSPTGLTLTGTGGTPDGAVVSSLTPALCWTLPTDAGSGVAGFRLYLNDVLARTNIAPMTNCTTPPAALPDGPYRWYVEADDALGNTARSLATFSFTVETQPPEPFELLGPADGATLSEARPVLSWSASGDRGVGLDRYEVAIDSGAGTVCPTPCRVLASQTSFTPPQDLGTGPHSWLVTAVDKAGKTRQAGPWSFSLVATPTPSATATSTRTATPTTTPTATSTNTPSATSTTTNTATPAATSSPTATPSPTSTATLTSTATHTLTATSTPTGTNTSTHTATPTQTRTPTQTWTPTVTATATSTPAATPTPTPIPCLADCNGGGEVTIDEVLLLVNVALGSGDLAACAAGDANADGQITVDEILAAVGNVLSGCDEERLSAMLRGATSPALHRGRGMEAGTKMARFSEHVT